MSASLLIFSLVCIAVGAFMLVSSLKTLKRCKNKTVGRITGISKSEDKDKDNILTTYYSPEFEYVVNGKVYHGTGDTSYERIEKIKIGGSIKVFYDPENPEEHFTKGGGMFPAVFGAVTLVFGVLVVLSLFIK